MCILSLNRLYSHILISIVVSSIYFIAQVKQVLYLYSIVVCIMWHSQKDLWNIFKFCSVLVYFSRFDNDVPNRECEC